MEKAVEKAYQLFVEKVAAKLPRKRFIVSYRGRKGVALIDAYAGGVIYRWNSRRSFFFGRRGELSVFDIVRILPGMLQYGAFDTALKNACREILKYADCSSAEELTLRLEVEG